MMKMVIRIFALFLLGTTSKKWRNAVNQHVDMHILLNRDVNVRIRKIRDQEQSARNLLRRLGLKLREDLMLKKNAEKHAKKFFTFEIMNPVKNPTEKKNSTQNSTQNPTAKNHKKIVLTSKQEDSLENSIMFRRLDNNKNGSVTMDELCVVLNEFQFQYNSLEVEAIMDIIDHNGSGEFELKEFEKTIRREMEREEEKEEEEEEEEEEETVVVTPVVMVNGEESKMDSTCIGSEQYF